MRLKTKNPNIINRVAIEFRKGSWFVVPIAQKLYSTSHADTYCSNHQKMRFILYNLTVR